MSITEQAIRELDAAGADDRFKTLVLGTMELFFDRYDSGAAVSIMLPRFIRTLQRCIAGQPLSPLTGEDREWVEVGQEAGAPVFQNARDSSVFKQMRNGVMEAYDIDVPGRPTITFPYLNPDAEVAFPIVEIGS